MAGEESFAVELAGDTYVQPPQKYHAKSLQVLRSKFADIEDRKTLDPILEEAGCLTYLAG